MHGTLKNLSVALPSIKDGEVGDLIQNIKIWLQKIEPLEYACFGCKRCIPAEAMNILISAFPMMAASTLSSCEFQMDRKKWPPVAGDYVVLDKSAPVAVSTLASIKLIEDLAALSPEGLCIVGKTETENIGIDKIIKNVVTNPAISSMIIAGKDTKGHHSGKTLLALWKNGVNKDMRVIGSPGKRPILKNVSSSEVKSFRRQIQIDNLIGCENAKILAKRVKELSQVRKGRASKGLLAQEVAAACGCHECADEAPAAGISDVPKIKAGMPKGVRLDKAGYFVIIPSKKSGIITVEHYNYENKLLRVIEGKNSRDIYRTIIDNNWLTDLSHAAYLGKELARAEISIKKGFKFVQDGA